MIICEDCIEAMREMPENSIDAIVTDPPYGLEFMGKEWDKLDSVIKPRSQWWKGKFEGTGFTKLPQPTGSRNFKCKKCGHYKHSGTPCKCDNPDWEYSTIKKQQEMQLWHQNWLTEAYRVLKPGGSMLVMGGTRTFHRLMVAIEDSGFIIKDTLMWIYGSGFPKAQDLGKMIDKRVGKEREIVGKKGLHGFKTDKHRAWNSESKTKDFDKINQLTAPSTDLAKHWDGFKIGGIKPAYEPIVWAVKPPEGSYIDNVLKWGVGAVNVDECRVEYINDKDKRTPYKADGSQGGDNAFHGKNKWGTSKDYMESKGRFPANIILDEEAGRVMDEQSGERKSGGALNFDNMKKDFGTWKLNASRTGIYEHPGDSGGASRFFYCAKASKGERNRGLEGMEEQTIRGAVGMSVVNNGRGKEYQSHGKEYERTTKACNSHPTVKPIALFEWLIKLVTREGQIILDPFLGSGTTAIAAHKVGRECVGIEREGEYIEIAKRRIKHWKSQLNHQLRL